jgi:hypothetical protein
MPTNTLGPVGLVGQRAAARPESQLMRGPNGMTAQAMDGRKRLPVWPGVRFFPGDERQVLQRTHILDVSSRDTLFEGLTATGPRARIDGPVGSVLFRGRNPGFGYYTYAVGPRPILRTDGRVFWLDFNGTTRLEFFWGNAFPTNLQVSAAVQASTGGAILSASRQSYGDDTGASAVRFELAGGQLRCRQNDSTYNLISAPVTNAPVNYWADVNVNGVNAATTGRLDRAAGTVSTLTSINYLSIDRVSFMGTVHDTDYITGRLYALIMDTDGNTQFIREQVIGATARRQGRII